MPRLGFRQAMKPPRGHKHCGRVLRVPRPAPLAIPLGTEMQLVLEFPHLFFRRSRPAFPHDNRLHASVHFKHGTTRGASLHGHCPASSLLSPPPTPALAPAVFGFVLGEATGGHAAGLRNASAPRQVSRVALAFCPDVPSRRPRRSPMPLTPVNRHASFSLRPVSRDSACGLKFLEALMGSRLLRPAGSPPSPPRGRTA